jgi:hypothetical protein
MENLFTKVNRIYLTNPDMHILGTYMIKQNHLGVKEIGFLSETFLLTIDQYLNTYIIILFMWKHYRRQEIIQICQRIHIFSLPQTIWVFDQYCF